VEPVDAADVHDAGRVVVRTRLLEQREECPGEEERRLQVQVEHLVPRRFGEGLQRLAPRRAGVVDQDVQLVLALAHHRGQPAALRLGREVGRHRDDLAELGQLGDRGLPGLGLARADVDAGAGLEQAAGHHQADSPGSTGDHGHLAGQVEQVHVTPLGLVRLLAAAASRPDHSRLPAVTRPG
jgi:hypothetical protein